MHATSARGQTGGAMLAEMTERRRQLLKLLIQEYVSTSAPVASEHLVRRYGLNVSSATIRNELASLEELGFLTHLHTSAGRIPTGAGYRFCRTLDGAAGNP